MATSTMTVERRGPNIRARYVIAFLLLAPVLAHFTYGFANSPLTNYYVTVDELAAKSAKGSAAQLRVGAPIVPGSIRWDNGTRTLTFQLQGETRSLDVMYRGYAPDSFRDGATVIAEGNMTSNGTFSAYNVLVKCPHEYAPGV